MRPRLRGGPLSRSARLLLPALLLLPLLALAAACGNPPGPRGWTGAQPVTAGDDDRVLAAHKRKLFGLSRGQGDALNIRWEFPPRDRSTYLISEERRSDLRRRVEAMGLDAGAAARLTGLVDDLRVEGPSADTLKDAIDAVSADDAAKNSLKDTVDAYRKAERDAFSQVRALYGDIGLSDDGNTAYFGGFGGWLYALDSETGASRWIIEAEGGIVGGATSSDGVVYVGTKEAQVRAYDQQTGERIWAADVDGEVWSAPVVDGDAIYVTTLEGTLYRLDLDGIEQWTFSATSGIAATPVLQDGTLYVGAFDNKLYAVDAASGDMRWSAEADNWFWAEPIVDAGRVFAASLDGKVYAVDAESGDEIWTRPFDTGAPVRSSPVLADDALIVASRDGDIYRLNSDTGERLQDPLVTDETIEADLSADEAGNVYAVPRDAVLIVIDAADLTSTTITLQ